MEKRLESANDYLEAMQAHAEAEDWQAMFDSGSEALERFDSYRIMIQYLRLCAAARLGKRELVFAELAELAKAGDWWSEPLLRQSPSFHAYQGDREFERIVADHARLLEEDNFGKGRSVTIHPAKGAPDLNLTVLALHGGGGSSKEESRHWRPLAARGCFVALPESDHSAMLKGWYNWEDDESGFSTIKHFAHSNKVPFGTDFLLAGFSAGGGIALKAALDRLIPCKGFILFAPFIETEGECLAYLKGKNLQGMRGYIAIGKGDESFGKVASVAAAAEKAGLACKLEALDCGHDFPPDFEAVLNRGLDFVLGK